MASERAIFAAGCFWGVEERFLHQEGVTKTQVGYTGGDVEDPDYHGVCTGTTGHAEAVELFFDPEVVSFEELLNLFWSLHDPTTLNRQGPDHGSQYRSAIFFCSQGQKEQALDSKERMDRSGRFADPIVTEVTEAGRFWPAEEYHQKYIQKAKAEGRGYYCH